MNGCRTITCPHCQGSGTMREYDLHEYTCPLCCGKGTIDALVENEDMRRPPPTSAQLLARIMPLSGRTSGYLLVNRRQRYQPQAISIYTDRISPRHRGPKAA